MRLESRTVALLFTDIAESTQKWARHGTAMAAALRDHDALAQEVFATHDALFSKHTGDGSMVVFSSVGSAVNAAIDLQRRIETHTWPIEETLHLRMGIHLGDAELRNGDVFGTSVNRAARIMGAAHPGQILTSAAADSAARDSLDGYQSKPLGSAVLRGLTDPEPVFQVVADGLATEFPALAAGDIGVDRLPVTPNEFIGRRQDVATIAAAISDHRLVTLTGPGGVGKTRLATEVARSLHPEIGETWFADLVQYRDDALVGSGLRAALGIPEQMEIPALEVALNHLSRCRGLLVLDNCEHLLAAVRDVAREITRRAPDVTLLATSQIRLGIPGERVWPIRPLGEGGDLADAARLFNVRAAAVNPHRDLDHSMDAVRELCRRLDGMPLAIELAASRVSVLSPEQILERLDDRFRLISRRGSTDRHDSLRATVEWSYELLDGDEASLFETLAVFPAGFSLDMAEAMAPAAGLQGFDAIDVVASLVDKSLIVADASPAPRFRYLDTIRSFALEVADDARRTAVARNLETWLLDITTDITLDTIPTLDREIANIESAIGALIDADLVQSAIATTTAIAGVLLDHAEAWRRPVRRLLGTDVTPEQRADLAALLAASHWIRNENADFDRALEMAFAAAADAGRSPSASMLTDAATHAAMNDDAELARDYARRAEEAARRSGRPGDHLRAAAALGWAAMASGDRESARRAASIAEGAEVSAIWLMYRPLNIGVLYRFADPERAIPHLDEAVAAAERSEQRFWLLQAHAHRGLARFRVGDLRGALEDLVEAIPHGRDVGDWRLMGTIVETVARIAAVSGAPRDAAVLLAGSLNERTMRRAALGTRADVRSRARLEATLRNEIGDDEFDDAGASVAMFELGEIIDVALNWARARIGVLDEVDG